MDKLADVVGVLRKAGRKPTRLSKESQVPRGPGKSSTGFLERLSEASQVETQMFPQTSEPPILPLRRKLQKLEGLEEMEGPDF